MSGRGPRPARRNVVVLFIDIVGSTELAERLDPELLMRVLDRYYAACRARITENGGVVEKYIGDAIMAVFGVPAGREDDALRAVLAARTSMAAVHRLSAELAPTHGVRLDAHCGVAFGEVMVADGAGPGVRVIGDPVNTASRLQSAAGAGEILVGDDVARLVRRHAVLEEVPPLSLKGKREPVRAWRLVDVEPDRGEPGPDTVPLVGRDAELRGLTRIHDRVLADRRCGMATVLGAPGIGKSRLVREFLHRLPADVTVLTGRCPSYGIGATYRPIAEMLQALNGGWPAIAGTLGPQSARVLRGLAGRRPADGLDTAGVAEIARAVRSLFEVLARRGPLVVVLDNLQWAEPTLLDLVEDCAAWLTRAPVLLVCVARPELRQARPSWGEGMVRALSLELRPLGRPDMARLVAELRAERADVVAHGGGPVVLDEAVFDRVTYGSDGNPLFAELMLEALAEGGSSLPPTIQALLGARLDRLEEAERDVLERAATIGQAFTAELVAALLDTGAGAGAVGVPLRRLRRDRLIRPGALPGAYEFTQTLTRETVYALTSKHARADWHRKLAARLAGQPDDPPLPRTSPADDTSLHGAGAGDDAPFVGPGPADVSQHLLAACRLTREVRPGDPLLPELTDRAAAALISDGALALRRQDLPAAIALLERGREMLPAGRPEHRSLAVRISDAWLARGQAAPAAGALDRAEELAPDDPRAGLTCAIQREVLALRAGGARGPRLPPLRERLALDPRDELSWCRFHQLEALARIEEGRFGAADRALRDGLGRAGAMGDPYEEDRLLGGLCELVQWSPTPVPEGLALCAELLARFAGDRALLVPVLVTRARLLALAGELGAAREALGTAGRHAAELHLGLPAIAVAQVRGLAESLDGDHEAARSQFRRAAAALRTAGLGAPAATLEVYAARESLRLGDVGRAAAELAGLDGPRQLRGELTAVATRAVIAALGGAHAEAVREAGRAAELLGSTDDPCLRGDILFEIARVHRAAGRDPAGPARQAIDAYLTKGASLPARRVHDWLGEPCP